MEDPNRIEHEGITWSKTPDGAVVWWNGSEWSAWSPSPGQPSPPADWAHPGEETDDLSPADLIRARIDELAKQFPANIRFFMRKELKKLPELLYEGEDIVDLAQGRYNGKQGAIVCTDRRVLITEEGLFRSTLEDFPYERISSVQSDKAMMFGKSPSTQAATMR